MDSQKQTGDQAMIITPRPNIRRPLGTPVPPVSSPITRSIDQVVIGAGVVLFIVLLLLVFWGGP